MLRSCRQAAKHWTSPAAAGVLRLIELFWDAYHRLRRETHPAPPDQQRVTRIHRAIVDALRSGDRLHVLVAMDQHFAMIPTGLDPSDRAASQQPH